MSGVKLRCEHTEKKDLNERGFAMTKAIFQAQKLQVRLYANVFWKEDCIF